MNILEKVVTLFRQYLHGAHLREWTMAREGDEVRMKRLESDGRWHFRPATTEELAEHQKGWDW